MEGNEYIVGLVSSIIGAVLVCSFIAAFAIIHWVLSLC